MIDLAKIVERIEERVAEMNTSVSEVSAQATDSKDTIRNWARAVRTDRENGTDKASATTIKINQIEAALGIELAVNASGSKLRGKAAITAMLRRIDGLPEEAINPIWKLIAGYLEDAEQSEPSRPHGQSERASRRRAKEPSQ